MIITPAALELLYYTTGSCGHQWAERLLEFSEPVALEELQALAADSEAFGNLVAFGRHIQKTTLDVEDVLLYFGTKHLFDANQTARYDKSSDSLIGKMLANCLLWPLDKDLSYKAPHRRIIITGALDLGGRGTAFLHRGSYFSH
jgi:hypothetical protein